MINNKVKSILVGEVKEKPVSDAKLFAQIKKKYFKGIDGRFGFAVDRPYQ